jgi:hypothetical protein
LNYGNGKYGGKLQQLERLREGQGPLIQRLESALPWVAQLFPQLPLATAVTKPADAKWPQEAIDLSKSILRNESLSGLEGGVEVVQTLEHFDSRWDRVTSHSELLWLYSNERWLTRPLGHGVHTLVNWCDSERRGVFSKAFLLGKIRDAEETDQNFVPPQILDHSLLPLHQTLSQWKASIKSLGDDRQELMLESANAQSSYRLLIDMKRNVVLEAEQISSGKRDFKRIYSDFVEVAGRHWAQKI